MAQATLPRVHPEGFGARARQDAWWFGPLQGDPLNRKRLG